MVDGRDSYVTDIWIYMKDMTIKYTVYICSLEGIFVSGT